MPGLRADATTALVAEFLRFVLELSPARQAPDHVVPPLRKLAGRARQHTAGLGLSAGLIILIYVILFMSAGSLDLQVAGDALPLWIADRGSAEHDANAMRLPIIHEPDAEVTGQRNAFNLD